MKKAWLIGLICFSCGTQEAPEAPFTARMLTSTDQGYQLQDVSFTTLIDLDRVRGSIASIRGGAVLDVATEIDEIIASDDPDKIYADDGDSVHINYTVDGGVVRPKDFSSMVSMALYHNFERTFSFWEGFIGLTVDDFGYTYIYKNPKLKVKTDGISLETQVKVNAAFLMGVRDFWFFKESKIADIPLNMNFAIMAHEFSHSLFDLLVAQKSTAFYDTDFQDNAYILSAINEGLADFFAYLVTGRKAEFADSLESFRDTRVPPVAWVYSNVNFSNCSGSFYCEGSILNSSLFEASETIGVQQVARYVIDAFPAFRETWLNEGKTSLIDFDILLNPILNQASASDKVILCTSMKKWFDKIEETLAC